MFALADPWNTHYTFCLHRGLNSLQPVWVHWLRPRAKLFTSTLSLAACCFLTYLVKHASQLQRIIVHALSFICAFCAQKLAANSQSLHVFLSSLKVLKQAAALIAT